MVTIRRTLLIVAIMLCADSSYAAFDDTQFRVVILAVSDFSESSSFRDNSLDADMLKAGQELATYFQKSYGVSADFLHTRAETSSAALKTWLGDYFRTTQKTITLMFVLTHGVPVTTTANTVYNSDLYLATSDASQDTIKGLGIEARAQLLNYFKSLPNGSSVFLFLDACDAGSVESMGLTRDLNSDPDHKIMILASSKATQQSYQARFTRTLQRLWETGRPAPHGDDDCTHEPRKVESLITTSMDKFFPLNITASRKQEVAMVKSYTQDFCFESFAADQSLLLVANPSSNQKLEVVWREEGDLQDSDPISVGPGDITPLRLLRKSYRIRFTPANGQQTTKPIDLSSRPFARIFVAAESSSATMTSDLYRKSLDIVRQAGLGVENEQAFASAIADDLSAEGHRWELEATNANDQAARAAVRVGDTQNRASALAADARNRQVQAQSARAEAATCCRTSIFGLSIPDVGALQRATERVQQADQAVEEVEQLQRQLATQVAQAELMGSQARIEASVAQAGLARARATLRSFEDSVLRNGGLIEELRSAQVQVANQLSNSLLRAARTDRGIVISVPLAPRSPRVLFSRAGQLRSDVVAAIPALGSRLQQIVPDALIEVEVYNDSGDQALAKLTAAQIKRLIENGFLQKNSVLARGFGRIPVLEGGKISDVVPSSARIIISSAKLGYVPPVAVQ